MPDGQLGWGIVGLGRIANDAIAPAIRAARNGTLVACCSRDLAKARAFAQQHGAPHAYDDYTQLLANPAVDAVFVASPNALHAEHTIAAARAGKHVLCEKPLALTVADGRAMIEACERAGVTLGIGLQMRFESLYQEIRDLVRAGVIGRCIEVSIQRCTPAGMVSHDPADWRRNRALAGLGTLYDMGPHVFDLLRWITGAEPRRVAALVQPPWASGKPDDRSVTAIEMDDGSLATVRLMREVPKPSNTIALYGTEGSIISGPTRGVDPLRYTVHTARGDEEHAVPVARAYVAEIEQFARQVAGDWGPAATPADALRLVALSAAIITSLEHDTIVDVK
jgi:1,5-anhydro-D-fructose reductase (1,5-anhydro-D-mannitol-forming)